MVPLSDLEMPDLSGQREPPMDAFWERIWAEADAEEAELGGLRDGARLYALELKGQEALEEDAGRRARLREAREAAEAEWRALDPLLRALRRAAHREKAYAGDTPRLRRAFLALEKYERGLRDRDRRLGEVRWREPFLRRREGGRSRRTPAPAPPACARGDARASRSSR